MPHYTTGLPKLDLEPFDPTPLWEAVRSQEPATAARARWRRLPALLTLGALAAVGALAGVLALVL